MLKQTTILIFILIASVHQSKSQSVENLEAINTVWKKFYLAFETLDHKPMAEIHSKDLIRISGGQRILDYDTYIDNYKAQFERLKTNNITNQISLRFFERLNNDSIASERGIYRLTRHKDKTDKQVYYGQFHVILKKDNGTWLISMDYDSSEANTIGEDDYKKAYDITDFKPFIKQ